MTTENTALTIQYRDGANYKTRSTIVLEGRLTPDLFQRLKASLDEGEYFVPQQIGLKNPALNFLEHDGFPNADLDHGWCELEEAESDFSDLYPSCLTDSPATSGITVEAFVKACESTSWDPDAELKRLAEIAAGACVESA